MIRFIKEHKNHYGVEFTCRVLREHIDGFFTARGYRATVTRPRSARSIRDEILVKEIKRIHAENYSVYGVRKMTHAMRRAGWNVGRDQAARLMNIAGVCGVTRGKTPKTTRHTMLPDNRPDLVKRNFSASAPNRLWVADITYVRTRSGFVYTAFVTDVFSRKIVGWATKSSLDTTSLPLEALTQALHNAHGIHAGELVHHSDRGSQYVSVAYTDKLINAKVLPSVGTVGDSYDNALAETVNGLYKTELIHRRSWTSLMEVELATMHWV